MVEKFRVYKEFLQKEIEWEGIVKDSVIGDIARESMKELKKTAEENYIKSTKEYILKMAQDGIEGFLNG